MKRTIRLAIRSAAAVAVVLPLVALPVYRFFFHVRKVEVVEAADGKVVRWIHAPGTVQSRFPVVVSARITAVVTRLHADQGDTVECGKLLARLDDRDLSARAAAARTELELARANHQRDREVFEKGYIAQAAMDATRAALRGAEARHLEATAALSYARIAAPVDGVITAREVEAGQMVGPGTPLFRLVNPRDLWVTARIDETVVGQVAVGQPAEIRLRTGERTTGKVARIGLQANAATRELEVDVAFDAPPARFAIDQEADVAVQAGEERGVVIPASALRQGSRDLGVLAVVDGRAELRPVKTGAADSRLVVVREGLEAGDRVIRLPGDIRPNSRVRAIDGGGR